MYWPRIKETEYQAEKTAIGIYDMLPGKITARVLTLLFFKDKFHEEGRNGRFFLKKVVVVSFLNNYVSLIDFHSTMFHLSKLSRVVSFKLVSMQIYLGLSTTQHSYLRF